MAFWIATLPLELVWLTLTHSHALVYKSAAYWERAIYAVFEGERTSL